MPTSYKPKNPLDGKLHTRYSELVRCTPAGINNVLAQRFGIMPKLKTEAFEWGKTRHEMWAEEASETRRTPSDFVSIIDMPLTYVEKGFAVEIFPNVILHFTPDYVSKQYYTIIDAKTTIDEARGARVFSKSPQLKIYGYGLSVLGIDIKDLLYVAEIWDVDRTEVIGYDFHKEPLDILKKAEARRWLQKRVERLIFGIEFYEKECGFKMPTEERAEL